MEKFIDHISIQNFKSIHDLKIEGLKRINLFVGKPNVGKSNILEAFGVFSLPYLKYASNKNISNFIRTESLTELFFDSNFIDASIEISIEKGKCEIKFSNERKGFITVSEENFIIDIKLGESNTILFYENGLRLKTEGGDPLIKSYLFQSNIKSESNGHNFLLPPFGSNLMKVIESNPKLKAELITIFKDYNLKLVFDRVSNEIKIMKELDNGAVVLFPFISIADTLQRIIFYKTAIASNTNSTLIFEEPEAHAFPPYIVHITQEIVESKSNQFIISTHSPYVLNHFIDNAIDELAIFMVDYKNGETVVNKLSSEDISDIQQYGIDLFTNYETFIK